MKKLNIRTICLTAAALVLTAGMAVGTAMAYFTTYTEAEGGVALDLGFTKIQIGEEVVNGKKEIVLLNTGDYDCYVRLKVLTGDAYKEGIAYSEPDGVGKWTPGPASEGYYYYAELLAPGESTTQLDISFTFPEGEAPADFNVIIIQENTPVLYDEAGNPYANWDIKADISQSVVKEVAE